MQQTFASLSAITVKFVLGAFLFVFLSGMLLSYVLFGDKGGNYPPDDERPAPCQQPRPAKKKNPCRECGQK